MKIYNHQYYGVYPYYHWFPSLFFSPFILSQCQSTAIWAIDISPLGCQIGNNSLVYNNRSTFSIDLTQQWCIDVNKAVMD